MFEPATIQRLADDYAEELKALIEHCSQPQHRGVTPSDFPLARLNQQQLDRLPVPLAQIEDLYPLSPMQQGMLFHTLYEQQGGDYINQLRVDVDGLDPERFRRAGRRLSSAMTSCAAVSSGRANCRRRSRWCTRSAWIASSMTGAGRRSCKRRWTPWRRPSASVASTGDGAVAAPDPGAHDRAALSPDLHQPSHPDGRLEQFAAARRSAATLCRPAARRT